MCGARAFVLERWIGSDDIWHVQCRRVVLECLACRVLDFRRERRREGSGDEEGTEGAAAFLVLLDVGREGGR